MLLYLSLSHINIPRINQELLDCEILSEKQIGKGNLYLLYCCTMENSQNKNKIIVYLILNLTDISAEDTLKSVSNKQIREHLNSPSAPRRNSVLVKVEGGCWRSGNVRADRYSAESPNPVRI